MSSLQWSFLETKSETFILLTAQIFDIYDGFTDLVIKHFDEVKLLEERY